MRDQMANKTEIAYNFNFITYIQNHILHPVRVVEMASVKTNM